MTSSIATLRRIPLLLGTPLRLPQTRSGSVQQIVFVAAFLALILLGEPLD